MKYSVPDTLPSESLENSIPNFINFEYIKARHGRTKPFIVEIVLITILAWFRTYSMMPLRQVARDSRLRFSFVE